MLWFQTFSIFFSTRESSAKKGLKTPCRFGLQWDHETSPHFGRPRLVFNVINRLSTTRPSPGSRPGIRRVDVGRAGFDATVENRLRHGRSLPHGSCLLRKRSRRRPAACLERQRMAARGHGQVQQWFVSQCGAEPDHDHHRQRPDAAPSRTECRRLRGSGRSFIDAASERRAQLDGQLLRVPASRLGILRQLVRDGTRTRGRRPQIQHVV